MKEVTFNNKFKVTDLGVQEIDVYDIEVEDNHNFFANNILVHNSVYLNLENLVELYVKETDKNKIVDIIDGWCKKILIPKIDSIFRELADYTNAYKQKMVMAREVIADQGLWVGKKRYALNVYDSEGVRYSKPDPKIMGLECVRSSTPEFCRDYIKNTIIMMLNENERKVQGYVYDLEDTFKQQPPEEVSFPRSVNEIDKWVGYDGNPKKGTPIHVRGCIVYNKFLKDHNFTEEKIKGGDKVKFAYLKMPNIFRSHVIAYPPMLNQTVYDLIKEYMDYNKQWEGTYYKPIKNIMDKIGWNIEKVNSVFDFF